jgi:hypothetical protein
MASQQAEKAAELQDPEERLVREEGETVVKGGTGGTSLEAQERLAEGTCICMSPSHSTDDAFFHMFDRVSLSDACRA